MQMTLTWEVTSHVGSEMSFPPCCRITAFPRALLAKADLTEVKQGQEEVKVQPTFGLFYLKQKTHSPLK